MSSFFEKLKKGMGIEIPAENEVEKKRPLKEELKKVKQEKKPKKLAISAKTMGPLVGKTEGYNLPSPPTTGGEEQATPQPEPIHPKKEEIKEKKPSLAKATEAKEKWFEPEGQLAIDVYQTEEELVIQSAIAGVKPENLDVSIEGDQVLIRGFREKPSEEGERNYFYQECYWGPFSRQIILPEEVDPSRAEAEMKEGILTIRIPKIERKKKRKIVVRG
jgi:HSP20 family molecular chaperone IbpA